MSNSRPSPIVIVSLVFTLNAGCLPATHPRSRADNRRLLTAVIEIGLTLVSFSAPVIRGTDKLQFYLERTPMKLFYCFAVDLGLFSFFSQVLALQQECSVSSKNWTIFLQLDGCAMVILIFRCKQS